MPFARESVGVAERACFPVDIPTDRLRESHLGGPSLLWVEVGEFVRGGSLEARSMLVSGLFGFSDERAHADRRNGFVRFGLGSGSDAQTNAKRTPIESAFDA
jgi:hypothetical protein